VFAESSLAAAPRIRRSHLLVPYQVRYLLDPSRLKLLVKSRRIGGSYMATLEVSWSAAGYHPLSGLDPARGENEYLLSASQGQSEEMLNECLRHLEALERIHEEGPLAMAQMASNEGLRCEPEILDAMFAESVVQGQPSAMDMIAQLRARRVGQKSTARRPNFKLVQTASSKRIVLTNGREIVAKAANPRTVRGYTGNLTFDEFGAMPFSDKIWAGAKPISDANLGNERGYKLRILGTPLGNDSPFYRLSETDEGKRFSRHKISIWDAVKDGFPIDPHAAREEIGNEEDFQQEYGCVFLDSSSCYIDPHLLDQACYEPADKELDYLLRHNRNYRIYGGMDIARSPTGDFSAQAILFQVGDTYWLRPDLWADRGVPFKVQKEKVKEELRLGASRIAIDATAIGANMAEDMVEEFPGRVEPVEFTAAVKEDLATRLKRLLEARRIRIPAGEHILRRELLALKRTITAAGTTRFNVERTKKGGHGDRAWALMLALFAAEAGPAPYKPQLKYR
jgi:phage FluMu gp28-like protein